MKLLELFKDGKKVAEIDVSALTFRELIELLRIEVNLLRREGRLKYEI
jgi:hypothetical protein